MEQQRAKVGDIVVDAGAAPDGQLPVAQRVPCETNSRTEGFERRVVAPELAPNRPLCRAGPIGRGKVANLPVVALELRRDRPKLVSESQVQGQPRNDAVIILNVEPKTLLAPVAGLRGSERASQCHHVAVNSLGQIRESRKLYIAPVVEMAILWDMEVIDECTELERMLSLGPVKVVAIRINIIDVSPIRCNESQGCHATCRSETAHVLARLKNGAWVGDAR